MADSASLSLTSGLTLEAWVKQRTVGYGTIFSKADYNGSEPISSYGLQIAGVLIWLYRDIWRIIVDRPNSHRGQWNHIALTWDGTYGPADNVKLYVNGSLAQSWTKSGVPLNVTTQTLTIGSMKPPTYWAPWAISNYIKWLVPGGGGSRSAFRFSGAVAGQW
ncbi:MAG: hypothetical protein IPK01_09650 [Acidobacteria bacterium]|nr:hypothetical protein [Acidobacteriota bacterium]